MKTKKPAARKAAPAAVAVIAEPQQLPAAASPIRRGCLGFAWQLAAKHCGLSGRNLDRSAWEAKRLPEERGETYHVAGMIGGDGFPSVVEIVMRWSDGNWQAVSVVLEGETLFPLLPKKG